MLLLPLLLGCNADPYPGESGNVLHSSLRSLPKSFDPPDVEDQASGKLATQVFEGLLMYHPFARPYTLMPSLASELPTVSEDGLSYTFQLRQDVTFHDDPCFPGGEGRKMVADDVIYSFKRLAHPATKSRGWWLFDGKIAGLKEWRDQLREESKSSKVDKANLPGMDRPVVGLQAIDDHTVRITLAKPYPQFLWTLAMQYTSVYPHEAVEMYGEEFRNHPVGTGPFRLKSFNPVYRVVLEKNPDYYDVRVPDPRGDPSQRWEGWEEDEAAGYLADAGTRIPMLDGMEIRFILEDQPRWLYFKNGYTDFLYPPKDNIAEALPGGDLSAELVERGVTKQPWTELGTVYACMNTLDPLMSNPDVRRAVALAFDHVWTVENLYGGNAIIAKSMIPPGVAGYDDYHPFHSEDGHAQVKRAKEYLAKAGYPGGIDPKTGKQLHLTFENTGSGTTQRQFAARFKDEMRRIGIEVDSVVNTFPQLQEKMRSGKFQITSLAWGFDYPDAQNILQLLYGPNKAPGINSASYDNPVFNELYERAAALPDSPERSALYAQMAHIAADDAPWVTRTHRIRVNLQHEWLRNFKYTEVNSQFWRYLAIDDAKRDAAVAEWNRPIRWPVYLVGSLVALIFGFSVKRSL